MKIIHNVAMTVNVNDEDFPKLLCDWADIIRKTFYDGGIEEIISLGPLSCAYSIFGNKGKAIDVCTARFDDETKTAFMELYDKVDADFVCFPKIALTQTLLNDIMTNACTIV